MSGPGALRDRLVGTLTDLLRVPSVTGDEAALCDHVEERLRARFGRSVRDGDSVVAGQLDDDGRPLLALLGHLDTVPGDTSPPPRVDAEADRVYGLGASDMKSGLAVMLELADRLPEDGPVRMAYAFYACEETDYARSGLPGLLARHGLGGSPLGGHLAIHFRPAEPVRLDDEEPCSDHHHQDQDDAPHPLPHLELPPF